MKFGLLEVVNLEIYDKSGNYITTLDTLQNSRVRHFKGAGSIIVKDALLNDELLRFLSDNYDNNNLTDYEKSLNGNEEVFEMGGSSYKKCKLIGKSYMRDSNTGKDVRYIIEIPNAVIRNNLEMYAEASLMTDDNRGFKIEFDIYEYNDKGSLYKIKLSNN